jgi:hypothetical protein
LSLPKSVKAGRWRKTLLFLAIVATLVVVLVLNFTVIPPPQPKVALIFHGFYAQTNNLPPIPGLEQIMMVEVGLTNEGKTHIWLAQTDRISITSEKLDGDHPDEKNEESIFTTQKVPPHSNALLRIGTLPSSPKWRVTVSYTYYRVYPLKRILRDRFANSGLVAADPGEKLKNAIFRIVMWVTGLLPDPAPQQGEVSTPLVTNRPPTDLLPLAQQR